MCCKPTGVGAGEILSLSPQKKGSRRGSYAQGGKENPLSPNSEPPSKKKGMLFCCIIICVLYCLNPCQQ